MDQDMGSPVLTTAALAARWHTSPARLANMRSQGRGPAFFKIGSRVYHLASDVEAYELARRVPTLDAA